MTLAVGTRLGPYEILAPIGAGGMGEVYRARDTRLERTVAIKVLPSHLSSSPELRQRLEREAKTISQLSHSHICTLYDVGLEGEAEYLVMEYLEGETLTDRLARGALPTEQLLRYGVEIADALDKAHRQGIVHRDLKPGNVMITKSGVKLLDFGLAKAMAPAKATSMLTSLPTMAGAQNLTEAGTILGTFQYMAPEQLEGREADGRSDIFAFGALLYEMATGRRAFAGKSQASLIAAILEHEPPSISSVQPLAPPALDRVVRKCLAKDPEERWQNAADLGSELKWIAEAGSQAGVPAKVVAKRKGRERVAWIGFALATAAVAVLAYGYVRRASPAPRAIRSSILVPPKTSMGMVAVSPDGAELAFTAYDTEGKSQIWLRPLDGTAAKPLAGTEGAIFPFWSPDSRSIGFFADKKLKRVEAAGGGAPIAVCDAPNPTGAAWGRDGVILMGQGAGPMLRVAAQGGAPVPATKLDASRHETAHRYPTFLPDGRHFLYLALNLAGGPEDQANQIWAGSTDDAKVERIARGYSNPIYASGHILLAREGNLVAQAFDSGSRRLKGEPWTVVQQVGLFGGFVSFGQFSASEGGILVCAANSLAPSRLQWVDRAGRRIAFVGEPALYYGFPNSFLSPDGRKAVVEIYEPNIDRSELWIVELESGVRRRLTSGPSGNGSAAWSPDGSRIAFSTDRTHQGDLYEKTINGSVSERPLLEAEGQKIAADWSPDGRYLLYWDREPRGLRRVALMALPMFGERKPIVVLEPASREDFRAKFSPDGRWVAYATDELGRSEVFVTPFPTPTEKWQVSSAGGTMPHWRRDGRELFYVTLDGNLMAVPISASRSFEAGAPKLLFETITPGAAASEFYDVAPDGERFLLSVPADTSTPPLNVIVHWTAGARK